ncbi:hypothetical protein [Methylobacterium sp. J-070]|nr:hypothetical protein [Methylobacterium sp. J-070]MCJ2048265.1 hypothetical protein [Methylobacterium sp. J-070]
MTAFELIRALAHDAAIGIIVTDALIEAPGPTFSTPTLFSGGWSDGT